MRTLLSILLLATTVSCFANKKKEPLVKFHGLKPVTVKSGKSVNVPLIFSIAKGFHVQSNPASQKNFIPTTLKMDEVKGIKYGEFKYPPCKEGKVVGPCKPHRLQGATKEITAYEGEFKIHVPITAAVKGPNKIFLKGKLRYQACNDKTCFFPATIPVSIRLTVTK